MIHIFTNFVDTIVQANNFLSQGSGHELYGGFPGYGSMLLSGQSMEQVIVSQDDHDLQWSCLYQKCIQAMPATGLGPSSMVHPGLTGSQGPAGLPGGPNGPGGHHGPPGPGGGGGGVPLPIAIPPQYSQSSYHPSYMQQQVRMVVSFVHLIKQSILDFEWDLVKPESGFPAVQTFSNPPTDHSGILSSSSKFRESGGMQRTLLSFPSNYST